MRGLVNVRRSVVVFIYGNLILYGGALGFLLVMLYGAITGNYEMGRLHTVGTCIGVVAGIAVARYGVSYTKNEP